MVTDVDAGDTVSRPRGRPRDPGVDADILKAGMDILTESGFERLSMEAVAHRAGVAKATIYRRFPSKVDLIVAMCQSFAPPLAPAPDTGSLRGDLMQMVESLGDTMCSTSDTGRLMPSMLSAAKENSEVREAMQQFTATRRRRVHEVVQAAVERGELQRGIDPNLIGDLLVGSMMYRIVIRGGKVDRKFNASLVDALLDGVAVRRD
ncbi:MAG: TetR/AcrR family transcriptional regulator [Acidimicrobiales bacterium]